jgi:DNA polymerase-3 subunit delta'
MELRLLPWQLPAWERLASLRERRPHALLLHGARDIGKRDFALQWAAAALCETPRPDGRACGACAGCQLLLADNHPDLRRVVPAADLVARADDEGAPGEEGGKTAKPSRTIRIGQVRELDEFLSITSHRGGARMVVLAPAEAMNTEAASALLKMLEEPPAGAGFILVSHEIDAVLPTIRSRCVLVRLAPPTPAQALEWLRSQGVEQAELRLAEAGGAPLAALGGDERHRLDEASRSLLLRLLARGGALEPAEIAAALPRELLQTPAITLLQRWCADLLEARVRGSVRYHPAQAREIQMLARAANPRMLLQWGRELSQARAAAEHPLNSRLVMERCLLSYAHAFSGRPSR